MVSMPGCAPFLDFDPTNSGVYLLKTIELLHQPSPDFASFTDELVTEFRVNLASTLHNFQN